MALVAAKLAMDHAKRFSLLRTPAGKGGVRASVWSFIAKIGKSSELGWALLTTVAFEIERSFVCAALAASKLSLRLIWMRRNINVQAGYSHDQASVNANRSWFFLASFCRRVCADRQGSMQRIPEAAGRQLERCKANQNRTWKRERDSKSG